MSVISFLSYHRTLSCIVLLDSGNKYITDWLDSVEGHVWSLPGKQLCHQARHLEASKTSKQWQLFKRLLLFSASCIR